MNRNYYSLTNNNHMNKERKNTIIMWLVATLGIIILAGVIIYAATRKTTDNIIVTDIEPIKTETVKPTIVKQAPTTSGVSTTLPKYISEQENWPPVITANKNSYSCDTGGPYSQQTTEKVIDGVTYCIKTENEGAAGTTYKTITYTTSEKTSTFTLRYVSCGNYGDPEKADCLRNQSAFDLDKIVSSLMSIK